jgi:hypothetical protein
MGGAWKKKTPVTGQTGAFTRWLGVGLDRVISHSP